MHIHRHHTAQSASTNSELIALITKGALDNNVIHRLTADSQTHGRGQHDRSWVSPVGNVYLSLYVPSALMGQLTGLLSPIIGLHLYNMPIISAINHARRAQYLPTIGVKWANDLGFYENNAMRHPTHHQAAKTVFCKLSGILIEPVKYQQKMTGVVIGVGLNVAVAPLITDGLYRACALADLTDDVPALVRCYDEISGACLDACAHHQQMTAALSAKLRHLPYDTQLITAFERAYDSAHALHDKHIGIFEQSNMTTPTHTGRCLGICADGTLKLATDTGIVHAHTGMARLLSD